MVSGVMQFKAAQHSLSVTSSDQSSVGASVRILSWGVMEIHSTLSITKKNMILLHYKWLFIKGDVFIGEWSIFGEEVFLHYSRFFIKGDFVIGGVECSYPIHWSFVMLEVKTCEQLTVMFS